MTEPRVLIVDDEEDTLDLFERFLGKEPYAIETVSDPGEAKRKLQQARYDLLISDIVMPEIDGFEVIRAGIRSNPDLRSIAVTGYGSEKVLGKVLECECFGYINKPFDWSYLKLLIRRALRKPSGRGGTRNN